MGEQSKLEVFPHFFHQPDPSFSRPVAIRHAGVLPLVGYRHDLPPGFHTFRAVALDQLHHLRYPAQQSLLIHPHGGHILVPIGGIDHGFPEISCFFLSTASSCESASSCPGGPIPSRSRHSPLQHS